MTSSLLLCCYLVVALWTTVEGAVNCDSVQAVYGTSLPCYEIHTCASNSANKLTVHELSSGVSDGKSTADVRICYDDHGLTLKVEAGQQLYFPSKDSYLSCNDAVFNADVVEFFITNPSEVDGKGFVANNLHCYSELDVNPYNKIFESGIYNPNLNHTGVQNILIDCDSSHITHSTKVNSNSWTMTMVAPFSVIDNPAGCPTTGKIASQKLGRVYRGNVYRINELSATAKCSSSICEYLAWSPTISSPPAFHEPTKFGFFVLV